MQPLSQAIPRESHSVSSCQVSILRFPYSEFAITQSGKAQLVSQFLCSDCRSVFERVRW